MATFRQTLTSVQTKTWLMYARLQSPLYSRVSVNIIREVCGYLASSFLLPSICSNTLRLYDLETGLSATLALKHLFKYGSVFCFYQERELLCAGGYLPSKEVFSIDIDTGALASLQEMEFARAWTGIVKFRKAVYVFGGNTHPSLQSCEAMETHTKLWRRIPDMRSPKVAFTPTVYEKEIYLACPMPVESPFEVFNPANEEFRALSASICSTLFGCVSFFTEDSLNVITYNRELVTWKLGSTIQQTTLLCIQDASVTVSNTPVVTRRQQVWWANHSTGKVVRFDLASNSIREFVFDYPIDVTS